MDQTIPDDFARLLARAREGDAVALDGIFRHATTRYERTAARLRKRYPTLAALEGTGDILQSGLIKLLRQYRDPRRIPEDWTGLEAHVRQSLLDVCRDLARKYLGPGAVAWQFGDLATEGEPAKDETTVSGRAIRREEETARRRGAERARRLVDALPPPLGKVVRQRYSGTGMTYRQIAESHGVAEKTIQRWLKEARDLLEVDLS